MPEEEKRREGASAPDPEAQGLFLGADLEALEKIRKRLKEGEDLKDIAEQNEIDAWDLAELVKTGEITEEQAESVLDIIGVSLCDFRAILTSGTAVGWDCLDCYEHGFPTCEIECSVPCEDCIRYNLCALLKPPYFRGKEEDEED